jgi:hypothetical protein
VRGISVSIETSTPEELENHEGAQHKQENLPQLRGRKVEKHRAWKDFCEEMPHSHAEGYAQLDGNPPRRNVQPTLDGGHIGVRCECPGREIRN